MARFWKGFSKTARLAAEADPRYQAAIKSRDSAKAQELACHFFCGEKAKHKFAQDRAIREEFGIDPDSLPPN